MFAAKNYHQLNILSDNVHSTAITDVVTVSMKTLKFSHAQQVSDKQHVDDVDTGRIPLSIFRRLISYARVTR